MDRDVLREPKQRVVRVVGRDLLARVRKAAEDLNLGEKRTHCTTSESRFDAYVAGFAHSTRSSRERSAQRRSAG